MKRIGMGLVGPGFVAAHHVDAVRRLGFVDVVAIAGSVLKLYAGSYHEPFNDLDREQVFSDLATWVG